MSLHLTAHLFVVLERCRRFWEREDVLLSCNLVTSLGKESVRKMICHSYICVNDPMGKINVTYKISRDSIHNDSHPSLSMIDLGIYM